MLSGSSLTESAHGSPTVSPITLNGTTQYYDSAAVAFPATSQSFSIMFVAKFNDVTAAYVAAKWPVANQTFICGVAVSNPIFYAFSSTPTFVPNTSAGVVSTGTWVGICCSFNSSTQDGNVRYSGVNSLVSIGPSTQNTTSAQTVGSTAATPTFNGQLRGVFYTETDACGAASDRVIAGAM
jgi:hypothetical protein